MNPVKIYAEEFQQLSVIYLFFSLVPRRSLLLRCPREVWERAGERTPSQYWQNTPDFSVILPLSVTSQLTVESRIDRAENA